MAAFPDFSDTALFPGFGSIPQVDFDAPPAQIRDDGSRKEEWYLLAQVKEDMTISKPTLVLSDRDGSPFALVFEGYDRDEIDLKALGLKRGHTAVIPYARKVKPADDTKRGFVRVEKDKIGEVRAIPGPLERILPLGGKTVEMDKCDACGKTGTRKCTGCERVGYCSRECQAQRWNEGHKTDCKMLKALAVIFR